MMQSRPVNDSALYRLIVLTAIQLLKHIRPHRGSVLLVSKGICIKYGRLINLSEASTMCFISQHTSIPVPKVICAFMRRDKTYIVMERIPGEMIGTTWMKRSTESRAKILAQLRQLVREMRSLLPPHNQAIANIDGGTLFDCRLPSSSCRFGPFRDVSGFHRYLRGGIKFDPCLDPEIRHLISLHSGQWPLSFTHGDLSSLNIIVRGEEIVAIIDWETAGWYPAYWEYTSACQVNPQNSFWRDEIEKFLDPRPTELAMERLRQRYFGDY